MSIVGHEYTNTLFLQNIFFGTGYINSWFSNREDLLIEHDLEGGDYVFQSSLAMFGIIGILLFLPFYLYLYSYIFNFIKIIRRYRLVLFNEINLGSDIIIFTAKHFF